MTYMDYDVADEKYKWLIMFSKIISFQRSQSSWSKTGEGLTQGVSPNSLKGQTKTPILRQSPETD